MLDGLGKASDDFGKMSKGLGKLSDCLRKVMLLFTVYSLLFSVFCLAIVYCLLLTAYCLPPLVFFDCLLIPRAQCVDSEIPTPYIQPTDQPTNKLPKYRAIPEFFINFLDLEIREVLVTTHFK